MFLPNDYLFYENIYNNPTEYVKLIIEKYYHKIESEIDILPDIYLINGFTEVPLKSNKFLINKYYITFCSIICLICQLVVPLYYIIVNFQERFDCSSDTGISDTGISDKIFSLSFFILMYFQFMSLWDDSVKTYNKFNKSYFINNYFFVYGSLFINMFIAIIMPIFTYILFKEDHSIINLMWNSLIGSFLVNLDNDIAKLLFGNDCIRSFSTNKMLISFINNGKKKYSINKKNNIELVLKLFFICQLIITITLCIYLLFCL
jgi:hypothetical protein